MKTQINKILKDDRFIFILLSVIFGYLMWVVRIYGDDSVNIIWATPKKFFEIWEVSSSMYFTWASRIFINFVLYYLTGRNKILFAVFMALSLYVLLTALSALFVTGNRRQGNWIIAGFVMMFPFTELGSAGWIATMVTYLSPIAFGMMGLVPIRRWLDHEDIPWYELIGYGVCLFFGANSEQMMIVLFTGYSFFIGYSLWKKEVRKSSILLIFPIIINIILFALSPGNKQRYFAEIRWHPTFEMLDLADKLELGFSTMMQWIIVINHMLIWALVIIIPLLTWRKYRNLFLFSPGLILTLIVAPMYSRILDKAEEIIPLVAFISKQIPTEGLISAASRFSLEPFAKFTVYGLFFIILVVSFFLLANTWRDVFTMELLLVSGMASRIAIGLSPTVFASKSRTNAVLAICLIAAVAQAFFSALKHGIVSDHEVKILSRVSITASIIAMVKFGYDVIKIF